MNWASKKRLSILYFVSSLKRAGPTRQLLNISSNLQKLGHKATVLSIRGKLADSIEQEFELAGVKVFHLGLDQRSFFLSGKTSLLQFLSKSSFDLIHSQGIRADYLQSRCRILPSLSTIRNFPYFDYPMTYGSWVGYPMAAAHIRILKSLDQVVSVSESCKSQLAEKNLLTECIPNGVDVDLFCPLDDQARSKLREKLGLPLDKEIWLSVGHLSERKDPMMIVRSFKKLLDLNPHQVLVFIGSGPLEASLRTDESDSVRFLGRVDNPVAFLQASDYFISASKAEGLPNSVLEALATGLPVCLSDIGPHREFFSYSKPGELFESGNELDLMQAMQRLRRSERISFRNVSRGLAETKYSSFVMAKAYLAAYLKLIES